VENLVRNIVLLVVIGLVVAKGLSYVTANAIDEAGSPEKGATAVQSAASGRLAKVEGDSIVIPATTSGHFLLDALVNGVRVRFLVDTGASDVTLTPQDARRLGFNERNLKYDRAYQTANGVVRGAAITLREVTIDQRSLYDVKASVNEAPMQISLLGMSFLGRLRGYEVADGALMLRW
jgi:aspartyl protease family protein